MASLRQPQQLGIAAGQTIRRGNVLGQSLQGRGLAVERHQSAMRMAAGVVGGEAQCQQPMAVLPALSLFQYRT
jgi:hypothetical protein